VINTDKKNTRFRNILIGTIAAVLAIGTGVGIVINNKNEESKARIAVAEKEKREQEEKITRLEGAAKEKEASIKGLQDRMAKENDAAKRALLQAQIDNEKSDLAETEKKIGRPGGALPGGDKLPPTKAACKCQPNDPMCDCL